LDIIKSYKFVFLYLLGVTHLFYEYYMTNSYKQFGFRGGIDDRTLSKIGSFGALFNGCFKIFWAALLDYLPFKPVYGIIWAIQICMLIWVHWAVYSGWQYGIVICLSFMCGGGMISMLPVVTLHVFGLQRGPKVYGFMYSVMGMAAFLSALCVRIWQKSIGYDGMLYISFALTLLAGINAATYQFERVSYQGLVSSNQNK
jgi:hypothetical protein